jgi:hypothetical protein
MDMTEFEVTGGRLLELLEHTGTGASLSWLVGVVDNWAQDYDRAEKLDSEDGCNKMHVLGLALCVLLHRCPELAPAEYDLRAALGASCARIMLSTKPLLEHDIEELQNLVTALQLEFTTLYSMQESVSEADNFAGYWSSVDTEDICVRIMAHLGGLVAHKRQESEDIPLAAVHGLIDIDDNGYCLMRIETIVSVLDALHSLYCLHTMLTRAQFVSATETAPQDLVPLHAHHREASNETFFTHSITADCAVGSIAQYAHRFAHLFHSVSQTIYYNYPTYTRQTQLPLPELQRSNTRSVNLLPLLTELYPEIPVLFEHTGAGCRRAHAKHKWSWVLWSHFVLLVDSKMQCYVARDVRMLAHYVVLQSLPGRQDT